MERYKSIVKAVSVSGARHAFLLSDGQTWVSVFLKKDQKPEFQQAIRNVTQGQEYIFDCFRNERGFLNILAIQHPSWPAPVPAKDVQAAAPTPGMYQTFPPLEMPGSATPSADQPIAPVQTVSLAPPGQFQPPPPTYQPGQESPATGAPEPCRAASGQDQETKNITEHEKLTLRDRLIARGNATLPTSNIICAIIEKNTAGQADIESFITWIGVKFVQLQDLIASNSLKIDEEDDVPF